ncbi:outer membrane protein assembly factor BamB family protein [Nannocystis punicea]|uniref:PQQ-like domain-containing protein n=1 Tax=Nannocystis punicea TaxID=2995304 RepID=A0ABY7H3K9_9BACT|nr:PQQ-binding-like beta-propeller repeat protein [Nannocystis poenicansa]WAS93839.1 hypothetical protein O0S08_47505 [Nannocystis poenicansa]
MAVISFDCPNCGAKLQPDDSKRRARCQYCGANFDLPRTTAVQPQHVPGTSAAPKALFIVLGGVVAMGVIGALTAFLAMSPATSTSIPPALVPTTPGAPAQASTIGGPPVKADPMRNEANFMWDEVGGPPLIVTIDGKEHVLGRLRVRPDDQLHVAVFAADDGAERYRVGPFGSYGEAYRSTYFSVVGERLFVTDFRGKLKVFGLADGKPVQDIALTDRAERFCLLDGTGDNPRLYLALVDRRQFLVDAAGPALKEEKLPRACEAQNVWSPRGGDPALSTSERLRRAPKVEGIEVSGVHLDGDLAVARGVKAPGTAYPMAFGFDPASREVRWKSPVPAVDLASVRERDNEQDILAGGRYFATYGEGSEHWHLVALDAKTGDRLWDDKLRSIFAVDWLRGIEATANHVFLVRMSSVEVYDAATGALKATIGDESYDG